MVWSQVAIWGGVIALWNYYYVYDNAKRHDINMSEIFKNKETSWWLTMGIVWTVLSLISLPMFFVRKCHKAFLNVIQRAIPLQSRILKIAKKHSKKISIITVDYPKSKFIKGVIKMNKK